MHALRIVCLILLAFCTAAEGIRGDRILGASESSINAYPYNAALLRLTTQGISWCSGSLISPDFVLTSASCLDGTNMATVILGAHDRRLTDTEQVRFTILSSAFIIHESWDRSKRGDDIGLIRCPASVRITDKIQIVNLPSRSHQALSFANFEADLTGWGHAEDGEEFEGKLHYTNVTVLPQAICKHFYLSLISSSKICTDGGFGKSGCLGDEGVPLVYDISIKNPLEPSENRTNANEEKILIGIVSFVTDIGCDKRWPTVYTRVTAYLDWIFEKTGIEIND